MAEAEIRLRFDGAAVAGQMDARLVGESLIAASELIVLLKSIDTALRNASPPDVRVQAFESGSFDINLLVSALGDVWEQVREFGAGEDVTAIVQLASLVGIVVALIKNYGDKRVISQTAVDTGDQVEVEFEAGSGLERAVMPTDAFLAFMNTPVRQAARQVIEPIDRPGVESVTIAAGQAEPVTVTKGDVSTFSVVELTPAAATTTRRTARVQPMTVNFSTENWRVSEGASSFYARVEDEAFLRRLDDGSETIGKTDAFEVGLRTEQYFDSEGKMKAHHAIERVISHQRGDVQQHLDFEEPADEA